MSDKKFNDFFKESFSEYSPEVPGHIWDNIAAQRKKKRPAGFWLNERKGILILAALLVLSGGAYMIFTQKNEPQNIAHEKNGSRQEAEEATPAAVLQNTEETKVAATVGNDDDKLSVENNTATGIVKDKNETTGLSNKKSTQSDFSKANDNALETRISNRKTVVSADDNAASRGNILPKRKGNKLRRAKNYQQTVTNPVADDIADVNSNNDISSNDLLQVDEFNIPYVAGSRDLILIAKENLLNKQNILLTPLKPREDCPGTTGNNYYVEAYISPDYVIKKYSDTANSSLVAKRKESLSIQSSYSAGVRYTRVFANGMSVRAGLNFSQVNEKFSYSQGNVVQIVYVINNQGDTTDSYYVRGTRYKNSSNRYRTIDVPVVVGYEMGNGNFHANINAGVILNLYSWQNGETIDNNGAPVSITTGKDDNPYQYKTNIGVGFTSAISLYYKIGEKFHALAEPYLRYNLSPMNKDALSLQERFTTIGLRLGIRMDIK